MTMRIFRVHVSGCLVLVNLLLLCVVFVDGAPVGSHTYIIHMDQNATHLNAMAKRSWYTELMENARELLADDHPDDGMATLHYVYHHAFNGFSARLTDAQAEYMRTLPCVKGLTRDRLHLRQTTRSPQFVGLAGAGNAPGANQRLWKESNYGEDVIIGVFDTGIWPNRSSFSDEGMGPVPAKWAGVCQEGTGFTAASCNGKIIGAQYFLAGYEGMYETIVDGVNGEFRSALDSDGHGTHCASTAAGRQVPGANVNGSANGTASGMAPKARIAVYKVLWDKGGTTSDFMAAYEAAINDGVDVISYSIGSNVNMTEGIQDIDDPREGEVIAAYNAVKNGIFVSVSGGNQGRTGPQTIGKWAPWYTVVAATTQDRRVDEDVFPPVTYYNEFRAPQVGLYSSRGPILTSRGQWLKPDIAAPGSQILAAGIKNDEFAFKTGTSMACPHVSGFAALLRSVHRKWSPAAIRSALMTTAATLDDSNRPILSQATDHDDATPWDLGAGFAIPERAMNPGLVYDMSSADYLLFMCGLKYNSSTVRKIDADFVECPTNPPARIQDANLPSFVAQFPDAASLSSPMSFARTLTNVGPGTSAYTVTVVAPTGFDVTVAPPALTFSAVEEMHAFVLTVTPSAASTFPEKYQAFGSVVWSDGAHTVRSPVVAMVGEFGPGQ